MANYYSANQEEILLFQEEILHSPTTIDTKAILKRKTLEP